jgi:hypothetical protein
MALLDREEGQSCPEGEMREDHCISSPRGLDRQQGSGRGQEDGNGPRPATKREKAVWDLLQSNARPSRRAWSWCALEVVVSAAISGDHCVPKESNLEVAVC